MNANEFNDTMKNYHKGTYVAMVWKTTIGDYEKVSKGVVRIVNVEIQLNKNDVEYIRIRTTNNQKQKTKVHYYYLGVEITKDQFEQETNKKSKQINGGYFSKHLSDIIAIGKSK